MNTAAVAVFLGSAAFILYVLFGYPAMLALLARWRKNPVRKRSVEQTVTVLLTVRDGERWIRQKLESILQLDYPRELLKILVISDGSVDGTVEITREFAARDDRIELIQMDAVGKAAAINAGLAKAGGEILFFTDVRQPLNRSSLRELVACLGDPSVGVVSGELIIREGASLEEARVGLYWEYEKWIRKRQSAIDSMIGATGAIYAMRRRLARPIPPGTLLDDVYLPLCAFFEGYRLVWDDMAQAYDYPTALQQEFPRKVRTLAGVYQIIGYFPSLLWPGKNRMWFHFMSHKLGRMLLPWALILMGVASLGLPGRWRITTLVGWFVLGVLGWADQRLPERFPLRRLTSLARTFLALMLATACAASIAFLPAERFWQPGQKMPSAKQAS